MWFEDENSKRGIIKIANQSPCWHCGKHTFYVDIDFQAPICSTECQDAKIEEFKKALKGEQ